MVMMTRIARRPSGGTTATPVYTRCRRPDSRRRQRSAASTSSALPRMRRPHATTVSAARTYAPPASGRAAMSLALASAMRKTYARGSSRAKGVSSTSGTAVRSGITPTWRSRARRRGDDEARIRGASPGTRYLDPLLEAVGDPTAGQIIRRHFHRDAIARQDANAILAHAPGGMGENLMLVLKLHAKHGVGQHFGHGAAELDQVLLGHPASIRRLHQLVDDDCPAPGQAAIGPRDHAIAGAPRGGKLWHLAARVSCG